MVVYQKHHISYDPEIIVEIRKGVHQIITLIRRFKSLEPQEIGAIEAELALVKLK